MASGPFTPGGKSLHYPFIFAKKKKKLQKLIYGFVCVKYIYMCFNVQACPLPNYAQSVMVTVLMTRIEYVLVKFKDFTQESMVYSLEFRIPNSIGLRRGLRICILSKLLRGAFLLARVILSNLCIKLHPDAQA